ncbi:sulfur carrier protein ThiS [Barnesiella sp. WM24]|uniref:sulfur carrier protein ThiS n=1 Tax=Barnesiella sp. WM24 TaxID=2558278 RepID=UPI001072E12E|nr:sulfur carrier protein ThiS [Barnesiella sp. WM24]MDE6113618.1 sulfur carrier protein ThiS [Muribaculum sp.]TFU94513.1 sulfur carrier protein ThiS [Barnesiella sp. WM24]
MNISVNNKPMTVPDHTTLQGALDLAGINPEGIATALNGEVVSLVDRDSTELHDGDSVLVIEPFYGG